MALDLSQIIFEITGVSRTVIGGKQLPSSLQRHAARRCAANTTGEVWSQPRILRKVCELNLVGRAL